MDAQRLKGRIAHGRQVAARQIGSNYDAYRPVSAASPLAAGNCYLTLPAAFTAEDMGFRHPVGYGHAAWSGIFDSTYTQPGDYLSGPAGIFFIAAQQDLLPSLCVLTTRTITVTRAAAPALPGINPYGGLTASTAAPILQLWPASILSAGSGPAGELPTELATGSWTILLPNTPVAIRSADQIEDEQGKIYVVGSAELTELGWRILAKEATP